MTARHWEEPETLEPREYRNTFGAATLTPVTEFMPVREMRAEVVPVGAFIAIDDAERLALITDNRRVGVSCTWPLSDNFYALKYSCPSRAAVCRVEITEFRTPGGVSPAEQIENMRPRAYL